MINNILKHSLHFIILILLQVLIVRNIYLGSFIILFPYILFILFLPIELPKHLVLIFSFLTGVAIDLFYDTAGLHAASCTLIGYLRHFVLKFLSPREGYEDGRTPNSDNMGTVWFITYSGILIFIHHLCFFYLEIFRINEFFTTLLRVILSSIGTFGFIYILQFLFFKSGKQS